MMTGEASGVTGFSLNHVSAPRFSTRHFIDLAAALGCVGVELRNDLRDKKLTDQALFDGKAPASVKDYLREKGLRLLGLSEVYGFDKWSDGMRDKVVALIALARESGAETISLIPDN